jgi:hypothetical protein
MTKFKAQNKFSRQGGIPQNAGKCQMTKVKIKEVSTS